MFFWSNNGVGNPHFYISPLKSPSPTTPKWFTAVSWLYILLHLGYDVACNGHLFLVLGVAGIKVRQGRPMADAHALPHWVGLGDVVNVGSRKLEGFSSVGCPSSFSRSILLIVVAQPSSACSTQAQEIIAPTLPHLCQQHCG